MHDYRDLSRQMERTVHKYIQWEKKTHCYGPGIVLSQAEIHTIAVIGDNPDINITELARQRGVTKGAASQMIYKLVEKGLVEKQVSPNSDTEVVLKLTDSGHVAYLSHQKFHEESNEQFMKTLGALPEDYEQFMMEFLREFEETMDKRLNEK